MGTISLRADAATHVDNIYLGILAPCPPHHLSLPQPTSTCCRASTPSTGDRRYDARARTSVRSEVHTSELQSPSQHDPLPIGPLPAAPPQSTSAYLFLLSSKQTIDWRSAL